MREEGEETWQKEVMDFINRGPGLIIRLRGLPYECTAQQVVEFFARGDLPARVFDDVNGVYFIKKYDGKASGDALAQFATEEEFNAAMTKHKFTIGSRYIELFRTPVTEVLQVVRRTLEVKNKPMRAPLMHQSLPRGNARDCIRLCSLPDGAQVHHVLAFLGTHARFIAYHGVHMVYNHLGHPNGEAFIQMTSEKVANIAACKCHNTIMTCGDKHRVIQVFQISGEEMATILSGVSLLPSSGVNDVLAPFPLLLPMPLVDPLRPLPCGHPLGNAPPYMCVLIHPNEPFLPHGVANKWLPEFSLNPNPNVLPLPNQQLQHFVSLRDV